MAKRSSIPKNKRYLQRLVARLPQVVPELLAYSSMLIYERMMELTVVDTGQALLQWYVLPTKGQRSSFPKQKILWGWADIEPEAPAGWKSYSSSNRDPRNPSKEQLIEHKISFSASMFHYIRSQPSLVNVHIYNPVTPGFPIFNPGDDSKYAETALAKARDAIPQVEEEARARTIQHIKQTFPEFFK